MHYLIIIWCTDLIKPPSDSCQTGQIVLKQFALERKKQALLTEMNFSATRSNKVSPPMDVSMLNTYVKL